MCGFSGFISGSQDYSKEEVLVKMGLAINTRGPDSSGVWFSEEDGIGLSHVRLAIMDLSPSGHQPMVSSCENFIISFNGEIYNHLSIRKEIEQISPIKWNSHSDTETLLVAIRTFGLVDTLKKAEGMFAFALYDKTQERLHLVRDRLGEKPLYFGWQQGCFMFGSQLDALRQHPKFQGEINRDSITLLLRHNYIPAPYSIYNGIKKLFPGTYLTFDNKIKEYYIEQYWNPKSEVFNQNKSSDTEADVIRSLDITLKQAIKDQMLSDVPLGAFLSGGIDSSTIVALMQDQSDVPVKTFSIGFYEEGYNEAEHAKAVAKHLGTEHTEHYVTAEDAIKVIPKLASIYDEPFSDSSQIPTYLVSKMAKEHVTVALSGDGGDELFCGYNRYFMTHNLWKRISKIPFGVRRVIGKLITATNVEFLNQLNFLLPKKYKMNNLGDKLHKSAGVLCANSIDELYLCLVSHWNEPENIILKSKEPKTVLTDINRKPLLTSAVEQMMALDTLSYLPDDILAKVDRAAMAVSLETRVPFLNHKVVEQAWTIPQSLKLKNGVGKHCLREVLFRYVPKELIERPKMGFGVPIGEWLQGPLKDWASKLLDEKRLKEEGFFDAEAITKMWHEHSTGARNWQYHLWDILMFQSWYETHHK